MQSTVRAQHDPSQRLGQIEQYLNVDPGNRELLAQAIDLALAAGDVTRATVHADAADHWFSGDPFFMFRRANVLVAQHRWDEAAPLYGAVLRVHADPNVAYSLADCQVRLGRHADACATMAAFRAAPDLAAAAVTLLVRAAHHLGDFEGGNALVDAHRARLADQPSFLAAASLLYLDQGNIGEASALSAAALAAGHRPVEALVVHATLALGASDADVAVARFNEVLAMHPHEGRSWSGLGMANLLRRDLGVAGEQLEQALKYMPAHIGTWHALGWCRLFSDDVTGAQSAFRSALELDRNFGESHGGMAVIAAVRGDTAAAQAAVERAIRLDPEGLSARYAQVLMRGETADPERFKAIAYRLLRGRQALNGESLADVVRRNAG